MVPWLYWIYLYGELIKTDHPGLKEDDDDDDEDPRRKTIVDQISRRRRCRSSERMNKFGRTQEEEEA